MEPNCQLAYSQERVKLLATCFLLVSCLAYSSTLMMEAIFSYETLVDFQGLHDVISQKIEVFYCNIINLLTRYVIGRR
jgi:hypothetical protein